MPISKERYQQYCADLLGIKVTDTDLEGILRRLNLFLDGLRSAPEVDALVPPCFVSRLELAKK